MKDKLPILIIGLLIVSCAPVVDISPSATLTPLPVTPSDGCLSPLEDFAYPIGDTDIMPLNVETQLPPQEWVSISRAPGAYEKGSFNSIQLLLVRSRNDSTEIWADGNSGELLRYDVQLDKWETIAAINKEGSFVGSAIKLFGDKSNLWATRRWSSQLIELPLLMRYDENKHQFVAVDLPIANEDDLSILEAHLDSTGKVWMLVNDSDQSYGMLKLYSLDLATLKIEPHLLIEANLLPSFTVLPDDNIALFSKQSKKNQNQSAILIYYPDTKQVKEIPIPSSVYPYDPGSTFGPLLFLDSKSRLWFGDYGWVDLSEWDKSYYQWFRVVRSPVFIGMFIANPSWAWAGPHFDYETPDGKIWYDSPRGVGWVDPALKKWCVFTSYSSKVLADNEQNLWIIVDGWLYKNSQYSNSSQ